MPQTTIDIEKVIRERAGKKAKYVPKFVISYLKRIVHQDWLNKFFEQEGDKQGVPWLKDSMEYLDLTLNIVGLENLPSPDDPRRYTFVSNHPLGGPDGLALGAVIGQHFDGKIRYLVNDLLMNIYGIAPLCVGVNKFGAQNHRFAEQVDEIFHGENHVLMFPADLCSRKKRGVIRDVPWKKTFITKSVEAKRDVVPIHFGGRNSNFFYRLANISKALGIKFNIAMLYLSDEMDKNRGKTFTITFGKPIPWQTFDKTKTPKQWAQYVQDEVYKLVGEL